MTNEFEKWSKAALVLEGISKNKFEKRIEIHIFGENGYKINTTHKMFGVNMGE